MPFYHRGIVFIGGQDIVGILLEGIFNHAKQGFWLYFPINRPLRIKNLVAAMLRVGLGKHHELNIGRIALQRINIGIHQVVNILAR